MFDKSNENVLWVKIGKSSLSNKSNTYIACVYNSKKKSTYIKGNECNVFELIEKQIANFLELDQIIIVIFKDRKDLDFLLEGYELDAFTMHGTNGDAFLNNYGEQLTQLCIASKLKDKFIEQEGIFKDILLSLDFRVVAQWT